MPKYIQAAIHKFQHSQPTRKEHATRCCEQPNFGATHKFSKADDTARKLIPYLILIFQKTKGTMLFYYKTIDLTIMVTLDMIAASQTSTTNKMEKMIHKLLDYVSHILMLTCDTIPALGY